jgi:two-component system, OmpR family, phosphate regulon sensor histidine kinase PhoR
VGLSLIAALAAAFVSAYLLTNSLTRRMERLRQSAQQMLTSPFAQTSWPEPNDEIGALGRTLRGISTQLREMIDRVSVESARREAILSSMVEGVLTVDDDLRVTFCNNSFRSLFRVPAAGNDPIPLRDIVRNPELTEMLRDALHSQQSVSRRLQLAAEEMKTFEAHASPLGGSGQRGVILILHDITDLERLERVRKDFVANVSHELRTPLTAICGYAETLLDGALQDPEHNRQFVEIIDTHAKRLNRIAADLLTLSELEAAKPGAPPEKISVRDAVNAALRAIQPEAEQRGVKLVCNDLEDAAVSGYKVHFEQAVLNLLQNAVKFNRAGGEVRVATSRNNGKISITVTDTGVGIPSEDLSRIFERFYRVDKARSRDVGGTGLGLSIVKHAVERMNGTVEVSSQLGIGSQFKILLPVTPA